MGYILLRGTNNDAANSVVTYTSGGRGYKITLADETIFTLGIAVTTGYWSNSNYGVGYYQWNDSGTSSVPTFNTINGSCVVPEGKTVANLEYVGIKKTNSNTATPLTKASYNESTRTVTFSTAATNIGWKSGGSSYTTAYITLPVFADEETTYDINQTLVNCTSNLINTKVSDGTEITVKLTANTDYIFETAPTYNGSPFTVSSDGFTATATFTVTQNVEIIANAVEAPKIKYCKITQTLTNCSSDLETNEVEQNSRIQIKVTANDGYAFKEPPTLDGYDFDVANDGSYATIDISIIRDCELVATASKIAYYTHTTEVEGFSIAPTLPDEWESGKEITISLTGTPRTGYEVVAPYIIEDNGDVYPFEDISTLEYYLYVLTYSPKDNFKLIGSYYEEPMANVSLHLVNCTCNIEAGSIRKHSNVIFELKGDSVYATFEQAPYAVMAETDYPFTISEDGTSAILSITVEDDISIYASATIEYSNITYSLTNAIIYPQPSTVAKGEVVDFAIAAREGFHFDNAPTLTVGRNEPIEFIQDDYGQWLLSYLSNGIDATITANAVADVESQTGYGYVNVYVVSPTDLDNLSKDRYMRITGSTLNTTNVEYIDVGKYILTLRALYLSIPTIGTETIAYGGYKSSKGKGGIPSNVYVTTDFGTVMIPTVQNNSIDYKYSKIAIYLPFIGEITLDTSRYMGYDLTLTYRTNIITGDCTACITSSCGVSEYHTGNLSFEIPIKYDNFANQNIDGNSNATDGFMPFVIVERAVPAESNITDLESSQLDTFGKNVDFTTKIANVHGYSVMDAIELVVSDNMTKRDIDSIESLVRSGVIL